MTPARHALFISTELLDEHVMDTARMSDRALLASKTIMIRSSLSTSVCGSSGGGGGRMGGGRPPGA